MSQDSGFRTQDSAPRASRWMRYAPLMLMLLVVGTLLFVGHADAQVPAGAPAATGPGPTNCSGYVGVANRIAGCVLETVDKSVRIFFVQFYPYVANTIAAATIFGIIIYGIMISFGAIENPSRDTVMLLIKVGAVSFFTQSADFMYETIYTAMNATGEAVIKVVPASGNIDGEADFNQVTCLKNMLSASRDKGKPVVGPWLAIDCMIDTVIGIKMPDASGPSAAQASNPQLSSSRGTVSRGLLYFFFANITSSVVGLILGLVGMLFLWSLITLTIKTLFTYLMSYIAVATLIIISPLIIPLVLFPGEIKSYFEKWYKLVLGFAMQPILLLVFISLFISAVDLAMFSGNYSLIYRIAGDESRKPGFDINEYLTSNGAINKQPIKILEAKIGQVSPPVVQGAQAALIPRTAEQKQCGAAVLMTGGVQHPSCSSVAPVQFFRDAVDWEKLASIRSPAVVMDGGSTTIGQQLLREVLAASIFCAVILFVMNRIAGIVPYIVTDLTGESVSPTKNNLFASSSAIFPKG